MPAASAVAGTVCNRYMGIPDERRNVWCNRLCRICGKPHRDNKADPARVDATVKPVGTQVACGLVYTASPALMRPMNAVSLAIISRLTLLITLVASLLLASLQ